MQFGTGLNGSVLGSMYGGQGQPAAAGSAISTLWKTTAQGASGQTIS